MNIETLRKELESRAVTVTFEKKNGEIRTLICTTRMDDIPEKHRPVNEELHDYGDQFRVFDITLQEWRSFLFHRILKVD